METAATPNALANRLLGLGLLLLLSTAEIRAQSAEPPVNTIEEISVGTRQGGNTLVRITLKQSLAVRKPGLATHAIRCAM